MAHKGKRLGKSYENFDRNAEYGVDKAIGIVKENATAKFDESVEIAMNLGVDPRHADQMVRGVVSLPHGTGRDVRVAVFALTSDSSDAWQRARHQCARSQPWTTATTTCCLTRPSTHPRAKPLARH